MSADVMEGGGGEVGGWIWRGSSFGEGGSVARKGNTGMTDQILMKRMKPCGMFFLFVKGWLLVRNEEEESLGYGWDVGWCPSLLRLLGSISCQNGMEYRLGNNLPALNLARQCHYTRLLAFRRTKQVSWMALGMAMGETVGLFVCLGHRGYGRCRMAMSIHELLCTYSCLFLCPRLQ